MESLKVTNYFHYYMFHLNADELTAGEKLKATVATIALGVFTLGIVPLICRLAFYDKSFKILKQSGTDADKTSKLGGKILPAGKGSSHEYVIDLKALKKMDIAELKKLGQSLPMKKVGELIDKIMTSSKPPAEIFKDGNNIDESFNALINFNSRTAADLAVLGDSLTVMQAKGAILAVNKEKFDKEKFRNFINPNKTFDKDLISRMGSAEIEEYGDLFAPEHWAVLSDDQAIYLTQKLSKLKDKQTPVKVLFNDNEERFRRLIKKLTLKDLLPFLSEKLKSEAEQEKKNTLSNLASLSDKELDKAVSSLDVKEFAGLDFSGFKDKDPNELKRNVRTLFGMRTTYTSSEFDHKLQGIPAKQLEYLCNGFEFSDWIALDTDQLAAMDLTKIKDETVRKKVINDHYRSDKVLRKLGDKKDQLRIIKDNLSEMDRQTYQEFFVD